MSATGKRAKGGNQSLGNYCEGVKKVFRKIEALKMRAFVFLAGVEGLEPPTQWLTATCSAD